MKCQELSYDLLADETSYPILSEEIRNTGEIVEDYCWIVDPLDGSHNFIAGLPAFGVSIALVKNGQPIAGVIYLPFYDLSYSAIKDHGAYMNGQKICVSTNRNLEKSMVTYDNMFHSDINIVKRFEKILDRSFTVRITGSAIYDFSLIASGKIDSRVWNNTKMYDHYINIDGIGPDVVDDIKNFFDKEKIQIVKKLSQALNKIEEYKFSTQSNSKLSEKIIVFTGTLENMSRSEAKSKAEELGAKVTNSVSNNTDYVIAGKDSGSKEKKARELNVKVLNENEWMKFLI